jgi:hypothetical protein
METMGMISFIWLKVLLSKEKKKNGCLTTADNIY